ncbi:MAG: Trk system potassium transporter TrkA [Myxococcales bacterium]|nr:Trk system potassium transporter TrkA [Myxococcales bacterium]
MSKQIIIVGAGEVGYHIAERLSREQWDVAIIDEDRRRTERIANALDVQTIVGNGSSPNIIREAGIERSDLLVAVTDSDEANIVACLMANAYAPPTCRKIARIRNPDYTQDERLFGRELLGIDFHINPEFAAASKILRLLETPQATDVIPFAQGRVLLLGLRLPEDSRLKGKSFAEIGAMYPDRRFLVAALEREERLIIPRGDIRINRGDTLFLVAQPQRLETILDSLGIVHRPLRHVAIAGGGRIGEFLARNLEEQGVSVRLLERDRVRCRQLAENLHRSVILHGDPTDRHLLKEENVGKMDAFVAVMEDEEENILSSLLAKRLGVPKVITLINKQSYSPLIRGIGVDAAISPRQVATSMILHFIRQGDVLQVDALGEEQAEVIEFVAREDWPILGIPLSEARLPKGVLIGALVRGEELIIPWGNSTIRSGDRVIAFALRRGIGELEKLLCRTV